MSRTANRESQTTPHGDPRVVHLEQRPGDNDPGVTSRPRRWRALTLILVYVLMGAHVAHWLLAGRTLGPVVFSESMYALEIGRINPGFVFFAVTLVATLLAGRFLCGWACHMAGLQELCAWILGKVGIRPRQFRVRLLGYVPLALALYMFVWPTFKREALIPAMTRWWPEGVGLIKPVAEFPGFQSALLTDNLWSPLPGIIVCVVFLLISGFATVAFLGARGLCRFGCPYGGFLRYAEQLAPARIVVDPLACDECGRCTAACASGVRVLDEIRSYGMVVDKECVRSLDCISVCPTNALSFKITTPALFKGTPLVPRPKPQYDTTWREEILVTGVFLASLLVTRGLYGRVSLLMGVSIAACLSFVAWKSYRMLRQRDVRHLGLQLKRAGSLRPAGVAFLAMAAALLALLIHSASVRAILWRAGQLDAAVTVTSDAVFSGDPAAVPPNMKSLARRALDLYHLGAGMGRGGIALADTPEFDVREAWLSLVTGDLAGAEASLQRAVGNPVQADARVHRVLGTRVPSDPLAVDLARIIYMQGDAQRAEEYLTAITERNPGFHQSLDALAAIYAGTGRTDMARAVFEHSSQRLPSDAYVRARLGMIQLAEGQSEVARRTLEQAASDAPRDPFVLHQLAAARFANGDVDGAVASLRQAAALDQRFAAAHLQAATAMLRQAGRDADADALLSDSPSTPIHAAPHP
ncbi:Putative electron transport protein YccM [Phycisphaerales bacterium]|nr:Putative electron transport protein YccM [Phycisphaerales bacterium]